VATEGHWETISAGLAAKGHPVEELGRRGQLTRFDATRTMPKLMKGGMPDAGIFKDLARTAIEKARAGGRYPRVRWWGEIVNLLYLDGNHLASSRLEDLCQEVAEEEHLPIFCSYSMDTFHPKVYEGSLQELCRSHGHLIPVPDYRLHRECVDRAFSEVFGPPGGSGLDLLAAGSRWTTTSMPASQRLLLWLQDAAPEKAGRVIERARRYEQDAPGRDDR
jgi:hypothetical protein